MLRDPFGAAASKRKSLVGEEKRAKSGLKAGPGRS